MITLQKTTKTLICIGSGGVGKTTMAASIAVGLATEGKKVLVLTIDPSMRLAQTLGISLSGEVEKVKLGADAKGQLFASVIDHQKTFEWFIRSASANTNADVNSLIHNKLYQQLSGRLSGSQDFTSLVSLYRYVESGEYDLVILDTPPSQHTWNFLRAPEKIAMLFNAGVASWFRQSSDEKPGLLKRVLNVGTTQVLKALETLTGSQFMKELSAFFRAVQKWEGPLENYISNCHRVLTSPSTEFLLVTALDSSRLIEAQKLSREILKHGYKLTSVVINRVPEWANLGPADRESLSPRLKELIEYYESLEKALTSRLTQLKKSLNIYKCAELRQNSENVETLLQNHRQIRSL